MTARERASDSPVVVQMDTDQMRLGAADFRDILECLVTLGITRIPNIRNPTRASIRAALERVLTQDLMSAAMRNSDPNRGGRVAIAGNLERLLDLDILPNDIRQAAMVQIQAINELDLSDSDRVNPHHENQPNIMSAEKKRQFLEKILEDQIKAFNGDSRAKQEVFLRDFFNTQIDIALLGGVPNYISSHIQSWNDTTSIMEGVVLDLQEEYPLINISFDPDNFTITLQKISAVH